MISSGLQQYTKSVPSRCNFFGVEDGFFVHHTGFSPVFVGERSIIDPFRSNVDKLI